MGRNNQESCYHMLEQPNTTVKMYCIKCEWVQRLHFIHSESIWLPRHVIYFPRLTNKFSRFVGSLVDKGLKGFLHRVDESLIPCKAALCHIVHLVLEVQQVLHHVLVFLWSTDNLSTKRLKPQKVSVIHTSISQGHWIIFLMVLCWLSCECTFM